MTISTSELTQHMQQLLRDIGAGRMESVPYETAWLARLNHHHPEVSLQALDWLCEHQLADGSWGSAGIPYYHDRVLCTLSTIIALTLHGRPEDRERLQRGRAALETLTTNGIQETVNGVSGPTAGFELIVPTLLSEAKAIGAIQSQHERLFDWTVELRKRKLAKLQNHKISRYVTLALSAEMAGTDALSMLDIENLQESNGSVGLTPSATAYFAIYVRPGDSRAIDYLLGVVKQGGAPFAAPFDIFERSWVLWNLRQLDTLDDGTRALCQPHVEYLRQAWRPNLGVSFSVHYTPIDADDISMTHEVLSRFECPVDLQAIYNLEESDHFRCYDLETHPSLGANIHILGALRYAGLEVDHPAVQKVLGFMKRMQREAGFWSDKWHASPYYMTAHSIINCAGYADDVVTRAVDWILTTQNENGSWGYYLQTAEETAYCLQALILWQRAGHPVPKDAIRCGAAWLNEHWEMDHPALWIGKSLYYPKYVVRSAILCALMLVMEQ